MHEETACECDACVAERLAEQQPRLERWVESERNRLGSHHPYFRLVVLPFARKRGLGWLKDHNGTIIGPNHSWFYCSRESQAKRIAASSPGNPSIEQLQAHWGVACTK